MAVREALEAIAEKLNNRQRERLDWKTPDEVWAEMVNNVALNPETVDEIAKR